MKREKTNVAMQFVCDLYEFWFRHEDFEEVRQWLEQVVALPGAPQFLEPYTNALTFLARVSWLQGRIESARTLAEQALSLARSQRNKKTWL